MSSLGFVTPAFDTINPTEFHLPVISHTDHGAFRNIGMSGKDLFHASGGQTVTGDIFLHGTRPITKT